MFTEQSRSQNIKILTSRGLSKMVNLIGSVVHDILPDKLKQKNIF